MGPSTVGERFAWRLLVGLEISLLLFLKQENPNLSATGAMRGSHGVRYGSAANSGCHGQCSSSSSRATGMVRWQGSEGRPVVLGLEMLGMGTDDVDGHTA